MRNSFSRKNLVLLLACLALVAGGYGYYLRFLAGHSPSAFRLLEEETQSRLEEFERTLQTKNLRGLAELEPICSKDRLTSPWIDEDILTLELEQGGPILKENWRGVDLSKLSPAGARFLKESSKELDPLPESKQASLKACDTVPCILNLYYGSPKDPRGLLHYRFYLLTGYRIALSRTLPLQASQEPGRYRDRANLPLEDYLFTHTDLIGLNRVAQDLPKSMRNLPTLEVFARVPRRLKFEQPYERACGIASSRRFIMLQDDCLPSGNLDETWTGFGVEAVLHEIAHRYDDYLEKQGRSAYYWSEGKTWTAFSGWKVIESVDPETGRTLRKWESNPAAEGFVREYAGSSPIEDFAETLAWVRYAATEAETRSPKKSQKLTEMTFDGQRFTPEEVQKRYRTLIRKSALHAFMELNSGCLASPIRYPKGSKPSPRTGAGGNFTDCGKKAFDLALQASLRSYKRESADACVFLEDRGPQSFLDWARKELEEELLKPWRDQDFARLGTLRLEYLSNLTLEERLDPREVLMECEDPSHPKASEECYDRKLSESLTTLREEALAGTSTQSSILSDPFVKRAARSPQFETNLLWRSAFDQAETEIRIQATYTHTRTKTRVAASRFIQEGLPTLENLARTHFQACRQELLTSREHQRPVPLRSARLDPMRFSANFVAAEFIDCLNLSWLRDQEKWLDETYQEIRNRNPGRSLRKLGKKVRAFVLRQAAESLEKLHETSLSALRATEESLTPSVFQSLRERLTSVLQENLDWLENLHSPKEFQQKCATEVPRAFLSVLQYSSDSNELFISRSPSQSLEAHSLELCRTLQSVPEIEKFSRKIIKRTQNQSLAQLRSLTLSEGAKERANCQSGLSRLQGARALRACTTRRWSEVEKRARQAWLQADPHAKALSRLESRAGAEKIGSDYQEQSRESWITLALE